MTARPPAPKARPAWSWSDVRMPKAAPQPQEEYPAGRSGTAREAPGASAGHPAFGEAEADANTELSSRPVPTPAPPPVRKDGPLTILDLTFTSCRWPIDPAGDEGWRYCGKPRDPRSKLSCYCEAHYRLSVSTPVRRGKAA